MSAAQVVLVAISAVVGIASVLGIAYAVFRTSAKTRTIELYAQENEVLGKSNSRMQQEIGRLQVKLDSTMNANMVLQETVSGTPAIRKLAEDIAREETTRREEHRSQIALLTDLLDVVRGKRDGK